MDHENRPHVIVQLWNTNGELEMTTDVLTRSYRTFDRFMCKVCKAMDYSLSDFDVVSGEIMLNDYALEIRTFQIPAGQCLLVDMRPKWIHSSF